MVKRLMIAGTGSGCGKTTVTCALLAALVSLEQSISSFKCGPDYIDPMFHKKITGIESRNLDIFLMGEAGVNFSLAQQSKGQEIAVLEGVMGIYDGLGSGSFASSNHISTLTATPAILVVNAKGSALSICALIKGFLEFEPNNIQGIILNNISESMFNFYQQLIEERLPTKVIGFLPQLPGAQFASRHLGLITAAEINDLKAKIKLLKEAALKYIDITALLEIAAQAPPLNCQADYLLPQAANNQPTIYITDDEAFCFYYQDNHDLLQKLGAKLKFFSPLNDRALPADADGLILWGGYPELYAAKLAQNTSMKQSLTAAITAGLPVYAECGGFVYLQQSLTDLQGNRQQMLGVLPGDIRMTSKLQNFGYYELTAQRSNLLCQAGDKINAHFFRYSESDCEGDCFLARKANGKQFPCIVASNNIFAGYQHLHFWGNPAFAKQFVKACAEYKRGAKPDGPNNQPTGN